MMRGKRDAESPPPAARTGGGAKRTRFAEEVQVREIGNRTDEKARKARTEEGSDASEPLPTEAACHSLDSDEEDAENGETRKQYKFTDEDEHEELDPTFVDGGAQLTAFNLDDELREGHFDETGNYIRDRNEDEKDAWLESLEGNQTSVYVPKYVKAKGDDESDGDDEPIDRKATMDRILQLLKPEESVLQALRRFGGAPQGSKWSKAKQSSASTTGKDAAAFKELTELSDLMLANGYVDIYTDTFEKLQYDLKHNANPGASQFGEMEQYEESDDDEDEKKLQARKAGLDESEQAALDAAEPEAPTSVELDPSLTYFQFKWEDKPDAEVFGPYPASQMLAWTEQGYFGDKGVYCRELSKGPDAAYYTSRRVDFDLFT